MLRTRFSCEAGVEPHLQEAVAATILFSAVDFAEHDYHDAECDDTFNEQIWIRNPISPTLLLDRIQVN